MPTTPASVVYVAGWLTHRAVSATTADEPTVGSRTKSAEPKRAATKTPVASRVLPTVMTSQQKQFHLVAPNKPCVPMGEIGRDQDRSSRSPGAFEPMPAGGSSWSDSQLSSVRTTGKWHRASPCGIASSSLLDVQVGGLTTSRPQTFDQSCDEPGVAVWPLGAGDSCLNMNRSAIDGWAPGGGDKRCLWRAGNALLNQYERIARGDCSVILAGPRGQAYTGNEVNARSIPNQRCAPVSIPWRGQHRHYIVSTPNKTYVKRRVRELKDQWARYLEERGYGLLSHRLVPVRVLFDFLEANELIGTLTAPCGEDAIFFRRFPAPALIDHPDKIRDGFNLVVLKNHVMYIKNYNLEEAQEIPELEEKWTCVSCGTDDVTCMPPCRCTNAQTSYPLCARCLNSSITNQRTDYAQGLGPIAVRLLDMGARDPIAAAELQQALTSPTAFLCMYCRRPHHYDWKNSIRRIIGFDWTPHGDPDMPSEFPVSFPVPGIGDTPILYEFKYENCCFRTSNDRFERDSSIPVYKTGRLLNINGRYSYHLDRQQFIRLGFTDVFNNVDLTVWSIDPMFRMPRFLKGFQYQIEEWVERVVGGHGGMVPVDTVIAPIQRLVCTQPLGPSRTTATQMLANSYATRVADWQAGMLRSGAIVEVADAACIEMSRIEVSAIPLRRHFNNMSNQLVSDTPFTAAQLDAMLIGQTVDGNSRWQRIKRRFLGFMCSDAAGRYKITRYALPYFFACAAAAAGIVVTHLPTVALCLGVAAGVGLITSVYDTYVLLKKERAVSSVADLSLLDTVVGRLFSPEPQDFVQGWGENLESPKDWPAATSKVKPFLCSHGVEGRTCSLCHPLPLCSCGDWMVEHRCASCTIPGHREISVLANHEGVILPKQDGFVLETIPHCYDALRPATTLNCPPRGATFRGPRNQEDHQQRRERGAIFAGPEWHPTRPDVAPMVPNKGCHGPRMTALAICARALKWPRERDSLVWDQLDELVSSQIEQVFGPLQRIERVPHSTWRDDQDFSEYKKREFDDAARAIRTANGLAAGSTKVKNLRDWRVRNAFTKTELLYKYVAVDQLHQVAKPMFPYRAHAYGVPEWTMVAKRYEPSMPMFGVEHYVPRLIQAFHPLANTMYNAFVLAVHHHFKVWWRGNICYGPGLNSIDMGSWFSRLGDSSHDHRHYDSRWNFYENDFSVYDSTQSDRSHKLMIMVCKHLGMRFDVLARCCKKMMSTFGSGMTRYSQRYSTPSSMVGMSSGAGDTTTQNTIVNILSHFFVCHLQFGWNWVEFSSIVRMIAMGDDNVLALPKHIELDLQRAVADFASLGFVAKLKKVSFLNTRFCGSRPTPAKVDGVDTLIMCQMLGRLGPKLAVSCLPQPSYQNWIGANARAVYPIQRCTPGFDGLLQPMRELPYKKGKVEVRRKQFFNISGHTVDPVAAALEWGCERYCLRREDFEEFDHFNRTAPLCSIRAHHVMDRAWTVDMSE